MLPPLIRANGMTDETGNKTFSLRQVEREHRVHRNTLRRAINEERLKATLSNDGGWIIRQDDLDAYIRDREPVAGGRPPQVAPEQPPVPQTRLVAELAADEHWLAERLEKLTDNLRQVEAENASLRQQAAILEERDKAARAVMLEVRELMEIQGQRIGDLKNDKGRLEADKGRLEADKGHMVALLKQAHDRLMDVDAERKDLLARVLGIVDLNIPPEPTTDVSRRRDRH